jgi:crotonobetainyl-CoA:carnitine CoA-transferase CaiB-like acyl-CoA transferase
VNAPNDQRMLGNIRVIDFTHIFSGPLATQTLGDMGADVIKIERLGSGDAARNYGQEVGETGMGSSFLALNRNKKSVALDMSTPEGIEVARDLILGADVVVQNFRIGLLERWGLDYETLSVSKPSLIYCSITGFGHIGEMASKAANDIVIQGYSGLMSFTGEPGGGPVRCGTAISDFSAGLYAAVGILGAIAYRERTGLGQHVYTSMLESQVSIMNYFFTDYWLKGIVPKPLGTANRLGIPNQAFPTKDGWVIIASASDSMFQRACEGLGDPELAFDPRFVTLADRYGHTAELVDAVTALTASKTTAECLEGLEKFGVSCASLNTLDQTANDKQLEDLGAFITVPRGDGGPDAKVIATPLHYTRTPVQVYSGVPDLGQDTESVLSEYGFSSERIEALKQKGII